MAHSNIRPKIRRRKVANLAAYSRQHTVSNCTIRIANEDAIKRQGSWSIPKEGFPEYKNLTNEEVAKIFKEKAKKAPLWKNIGKAAKMEAYTQDKLKKWEKKHPKPCPTDDLFKDEFIPAWEKEREEALIRIRDFVVSMFDKLPLTGRYQEGENKFTEKPVAELKDVNGEGHRVNELDEKSKLLDKAQKATNKEKAKNAKLIATNLKDHKRKKGRVILPKAA